ncbi:MAG: tetratricopeptide repeat protein [Candidatus Odinarchaeota archaeon]
MVQTPKLDDYYQLKNSWKSWRKYFKEWVSLVSHVIFDAHIPVKSTLELPAKPGRSATTPLDYVTKETDFSLVIKSKKWKEEGNYERIISSIKLSDVVMDLNWKLVDAYLELENKAKASEILEQVKDRLIMPLDTARWHYYYGRMLYIAEDYANAFNYMYKAVNQPVVANHRLYQEIKEWMSNPVRKYLNFEEQVYVESKED